MPRVKKNKQENVFSQYRKWRVALYIRLSKEDGNDESLSVQNQRARLNAHLQTLMTDEDMVLVDVYVDDGITGVTSDREHFQRMLGDIESGKVNCVIVKDLSRLSRNDWELKMYLQLIFVVNDVRFISMELPALDTFITPEAVYDWGVSMQSQYNEQHPRETSIKVKGTLYRKMADGEFIGAFAPYGYLKDPKDRHRLVVNPDTAPIVREIFHWYVYDGMSKQAITKKLIEQGTPSPASYKHDNVSKKYHNPHTDAAGHGLWSHRTVDQILRNEVYIGNLVQGKKRVKSYKIKKIVPVDPSEWKRHEGVHEPVVDKETFALAQSLMQKDMRQSPTQKQVYPFSGLLACADCGKGMTRTASRGYVYYACKTYVHKSHDLCTRHPLKHSELEKSVLEAIKVQIALVENLAQAIDEINSAPVVRTVSLRLESLIKLKTQEYEKVCRIKDGLYVDWKNEDITREEYHRMKREYEEKAEEIKNTLDNLHHEKEDMSNGVTSDNPYLKTFLKHKNIQTLDRGILVELIDKVHVHEDSSLTIDFNFADEHRRVIEFIENNRRELTVIEKTATA